MGFEWDEANRLANLDKHGIDFIDVPEVFEGNIVTVEDDRYTYGEQRFVHRASPFSRTMNRSILSTLELSPVDRGR